MSEETPIERIWAYVHGEMELPERAAIEQAAKQDPELAGEIERLESLHGQFRDIMPLTDWTSEDLEDRILEALEKDLPDEREARQPAARPIAFPKIRVDISAWTIRLWSTGIAAAAASLFILGGVAHYMNGPIGWSQPEFAVAQYRGVNDPLYSKADAATCLSALKKAVHDEYTRLVPGRRGALLRPGKARWRLRFRFRETPEARLSVEVQATDEQQSPVRLWMSEYDSVADCVAGTGAFAGQVAKDLAYKDK